MLFLVLLIDCGKPDIRQTGGLCQSHKYPNQLAGGSLCGGTQPLQFDHVFLREADAHDCRELEWSRHSESFQWDKKDQRGSWSGSVEFCCKTRAKTRVGQCGMDGVSFQE